MGLFPKAARQLLDAQGIPSGPNSQIYIVDPANGSDSSPGTSFEQPLATVAAAYAKCTTNQNDAVVMVGGPTADALSAAITWSKDYTHLVGMSAPLPGVGQRCRITGSATADLTVLITLSGDGCIFRNVQIANFADADVDSGAMVVSGNRNALINCFIAGMGHATPGARAGSYSLSVTGEECLFEDCAIGLDTVLRAAANAELVIGSGATRLIFKHCRFLSQSETAGKFLVSVADGMDRWIEFEDCIFHNFSTNWATTLTNAIDMNATATHNIFLRGAANQLVGISGWADVVTRIHTAAPAPDAGAGVSTNPTT